MFKISALVVAASVALLSMPASAQDAADATLRVDTGSVMASDGGEFATARTGAALTDGDRLMLVEGSTATVVYENGCTRTYDTPGVYVVSANCVPAAVAGTGGVDVGSAAIIAGVAIGAAAILASMDESDGPAPPPVSR